MIASVPFWVAVASITAVLLAVAAVDARRPEERGMGGAADVSLALFAPVGGWPALIVSMVGIPLTVATAGAPRWAVALSLTAVLAAATVRKFRASPVFVAYAAYAASTLIVLAAAILIAAADFVMSIW